MNGSIRYYRPCLLMLIAFVYQLGAGSCGCLEHNSWYRTLSSFFSLAHERPGDEGDRQPVSPAEPSWCDADHECVPRPPHVYRSNPSMHQEWLTLSLLGPGQYCPGPMVTDATDASIGSAILAEFDGHWSPPSAATRLAQLQFFRL